MRETLPTPTPKPASADRPERPTQGPDVLDRSLDEQAPIRSQEHRDPQPVLGDETVVGLYVDYHDLVTRPTRLSLHHW